MNKNVWKFFGISLFVAGIDQLLKLWVYFHMKMGVIGQIKLIGNWVKLFYTLNPGMAFGIQFGFTYDKIILTLIRIVASVMIVHYIWQLAKNANRFKALLWGWALVLGGAIGNGIDSIFYGKFLHNAPYGAPMNWFYGQVIDMLYIDLWSGKLPSWIPWFSGYYVTCLPIFNLADVAILLGVVFILRARNHLFNIEKSMMSPAEEMMITEVIEGPMDAVHGVLGNEKKQQDGNVLIS